MNKVLVIFDKNETDLSGYHIYDKSEWENICTTFLNNHKNISSNILQEWLERYAIKEITDEEAKIITRIIGNKHGFFMCPSTVSGQHILSVSGLKKYFASNLNQ
jgi:hypothetical protein